MKTVEEAKALVSKVSIGVLCSSRVSAFILLICLSLHLLETSPS